MHKNELFLYMIDSSDLIIKVSENWDGFAHENQGDMATEKHVLHRCLWDFIAGAETVMIYKGMVDKVRRESVTVHFPFRCDAPNCRRYMEMSMVPKADQAVEFRSRILREVDRSKIALFDAAAAREDEFLSVCSWCKDIRCEDEWCAAEEAVRRLNLFKRSVLPMISHGICPTCSEQMENEFSDCA